MSEKLIKFAAATPDIRVADLEFNKEAILRLVAEAEAQGVNALCLPELCLTGATCGDLFFHDALVLGAAMVLEDILARTKDADILFALGLPFKTDSRLYNCAAVCQRGKLLWLVPKSAPSYGEKRWFSDGDGVHEATVFAGLQTWLSYYSGFEVCGVPAHVAVGDKAYDTNWSQIVLNLAADPEIMGRAAKRREALKNFTSQTGAALVRAGAGAGESTTDAVFAGHSIIATNGEILAEKRFESGMIVAEVNVSSLISPQELTRSGFASYCSKKPSTSPFAPKSGEGCEDALRIAARGLSSRMRHVGAKKAVIGVSGGLDSTLALLICARALDELDLPHENIIAITMPGFGTTGRTKNNAEALARLLGASFREISIAESVRQHFADIGYDENARSAVFENAQARERTQILMDIANDCNGIVVGTGDMSELALGWATYNGDHMAMYGVNAGIPKTLVRALVAHVADTDSALESVLRDVLATPVSPELLPIEEGGHKTEDIVGPYELHDFFLYYFCVRNPSRAILEDAERAFEGIYDRAEILKWLRVFIRRFFSQQFKRSCMPDGPQVVGFSLSPRGGLVMPSDASAALWLRELEGM